MRADLMNITPAGGRKNHQQSESQKLFTEENKDDLMEAIYDGETVRKIDALKLNPQIDESINGPYSDDRFRQEYFVMINKIEFEGEELFVVFGDDEDDNDHEFDEYDEEVFDEGFKFAKTQEEADILFDEFYNEWKNNFK